MNVLFRMWPNTEQVVALFPEWPADYSGRYCVCYQHVGQHGSADVDYMMGETRPATFAEALPLYEELQEIGYDDLEPTDEVDSVLAREVREEKLGSFKE